METNRRQFLGQAGLAATAGLAWQTLSPLGHTRESINVQTDASPIVDCHQHLWDLTKFKLPWLAPGTKLARSYVTKDYLEAIDGTGIRHAVYMEVDVDPAQQQAEAEHLIEICNSGKAPTIAAVISGRPNAAGFKDYIMPLAANPAIKGIRQVLHSGATPAGYCLSPEFVRGMHLLGELGLSFDFCTRTKELADGAKLAGQCPETRFIVDHCGNADVKAFFKPDDPRLKETPAEHDADSWKRDMERLAAQKNVICKISGIIARVPREWSADDLAPVVNHCLDTFGPKRVIFGSDWPVCLIGAPLREWVAALREIIAPRPAAEQKALLTENAIAFYGLKV